MRCAISFQKHQTKILENSTNKYCFHFHKKTLLSYALYYWQYNVLFLLIYQSFMKQQFIVTNRHTVLQNTEEIWLILNRPTFKHVIFFREMHGQAFFFHRHNILTAVVFVTQLSNNAGNLSLTICVGYDNKFPFHERCRSSISHTKKKVTIALLVFVAQRFRKRRVKCCPNVSTWQHSKCLETLRSQSSVPLSLLKFSQSLDFQILYD